MEYQFQTTHGVISAWVTKDVERSQDGDSLLGNKLMRRQWRFDTVIFPTCMSFVLIATKSFVGNNKKTTRGGCHELIYEFSIGSVRFTEQALLSLSKFKLKKKECTNIRCNLRLGSHRKLHKLGR